MQQPVNFRLLLKFIARSLFPWATGSTYFHFIFRVGDVLRVYMVRRLPSQLLATQLTPRRQLTNCQAIMQSANTQIFSPFFFFIFASPIPHVPCPVPLSPFVFITQNMYLAFLIIVHWQGFLQGLLRHIQKCCILVAQVLHNLCSKILCPFSVPGSASLRIWR